MATTGKDTAFLFVPAIIGGIILLAIILLDIQFSNFRQAYFQEVAEETKRNNSFLVRAFRDLLETGQVDKMHRMLNKYHGPNPVIVKIIARGKGVIMETEGVPAYLAEHVRRPEIKGIFNKNSSILRFEGSQRNKYIKEPTIAIIANGITIHLSFRNSPELMQNCVIAGSCFPCWANISLKAGNTNINITRTTAIASSITNIG